MKNININSENGITLISLVAMMIIIFTILSVILYNGRVSARLERLNDMYSDIETLEESLKLIYMKNETIATTGEKTTLDFDDANPNDDVDQYYKISDSVLSGIELNNSIDDYYVNRDTLTVYYKDGYEYKGITYHTLPRDYSKVSNSENYLKEFKITMKTSEDDEGEVKTYTGRYELEAINNYFDQSQNSWLYFNGWKDEETGIYYRYAYKGSPRTVVADFVKYKEKVKVAFYDGTLLLMEKEYVVGEEYGELPSISVDGVTPIGWMNKNGEIVTASMTVTTSETELYAIWPSESTETDISDGTYTVYFDPLTGSVDIESKTVTYGELYGTLPEAVPASDDYQFSGWFTDENYETEITANSIVKLSGNITLYAKYTKITFTVTLNYNRPDEVTESTKITVKNGDTYSNLPLLENIEIDGKIYTFAGWYTEAEDGEKILSTDTVNLEDDVTYYAHWEEE